MLLKLRELSPEGQLPPDVALQKVRRALGRSQRRSVPPNPARSAAKPSPHTPGVVGGFFGTMRSTGTGVSSLNMARSRAESDVLVLIGNVFISVKMGPLTAEVCARVNEVPEPVTS